MKEFTRRSFIGTSLCSLPVVLLAGNRILDTHLTKIVGETIYGKVQGYEFNGVNIFRGIPYGESTEGQYRFLPPLKPKKWVGILDSTKNEPRCYQDGDAIFYGDWLGPYFAGGRADRKELSKQEDSENCLTVNVTTTSLTGNRPVMVYIHGGGFSTGSGMLAVFADKHVREQDVVVVGITHRLNIFGYIYLGGLSEKYAVGNPGQLDLIAALEWVRDNIENFGGDPNNVMIFGESGGGAKISTLLAMPAAKGLFHKASIQSGSMFKVTDAKKATQSAKGIMEKLGISKVEDLLKIPASELLKAGSRGLMGYTPVIDGQTLFRHPWDPDAPEMSASIPLMIGNDKDESTLFAAMGNENDIYNLTDAGLRSELLKKGIPENRIDEVIALYKSNHPAENPSDLYFRISTDRGARFNTTRHAELQLTRGKADVFVWYFQWNTPYLESKMRAFHTADLPLSMRLTLYQESENLSKQLSAAWASFARNSNPSTKEHPWPSYTTNKRTTMVFDVNGSKAIDDPDKEERIIIKSMPSGSIL
ncbi:carboxylesterase/lipase family protein [Draconibacterium sp.]|jgi:para-nitrobenzyl esterase